MPDTLGSDNPIAERRYAYARAAAREGDWRTAAEVLEQTLEIAPRWAAAWFALGEALQQLHDFAGAQEKFAQCLRLEPADAQGAQLRLAALGAAQPQGLPAAYVARLFDDYAPRFNAHLVGELSYRGPELVAAALDAVAPERKFRRGLDLGCGSGLAGAALRTRSEVLVGVDISPKMIVEAARTKLYDELRVGDFFAFLAGQLEGEADLVVAADVFMYVGDLAPAFTAIARALASDGLLAFTVESEPGEAFGLGETLRFRHSCAHVERALAAAKLDAILLQDAWARKEAGAPAPGLIAVASPARSPR